MSSCQNDDYSPKPRAYHRIVFPQTNFSQTNITGCPFVLDIPNYADIQDDTKASGKCWKNIHFKQFNAQIHLSYYDINPQSSFEQLTEDARTFAFKHTSKASSIDQKKIAIPEHRIYGLEYYIDGNTASNYQFYISDSSKHYLRGALYFNEKPNLDSIQPVLDFLKKDITKIIHSIRWK